MAAKTREIKGIVVGHSAKHVAEKRIPITLVSSKVTDPFLSGVIQVLVDGRVANVQCPLNTACVKLSGKQQPTYDEVRRVIDSTVTAYPLGTELMLLEKVHISHDGQAKEPFYMVRHRPVVNQSINHPRLAPRKQKAAPVTPAVPAELTDAASEETPAEPIS
jgi:hypothetical protein